jgi:hypothetical protein
MLVCVYGTADQHRVERINIFDVEKCILHSIVGRFWLEKSIFACKFNVKIPRSNDLNSLMLIYQIPVLLNIEEGSFHVEEPDFVSHGMGPRSMLIRYVSSSLYKSGDATFISIVFASKREVGRKLWI